MAYSDAMVASYSDILDQPWIKWRLVAWRHQALEPMLTYHQLGYSDILLWLISQEIALPSIVKSGLRTTYLAFEYIRSHWVNTLRSIQNGRHFADDIFKCIFLNENIWFPIKISLKSVPKGQSNNIPALVQIMAWRRPGDKPSSELMMVSLPMHICVNRPQWVNNTSEYNVLSFY